MIIGILHKGSGAGDQLFSYIATRVRAADLGVDFGFVGKEFFKCKDFMSVEWGEKVDIPYHIEEMTGRLIPLNDWPIYDINKPYFDPEFNFIPDGSVINGYGAQSEQYWGHRLDEISEWLKVEPLKVEDEKQIWNIRGGEYRGVPNLFLPKEYWKLASDDRLSAEIHTDDPSLAAEWFPQIPHIQDISLNWRSLRYAKYAVISNSAFAIIPRLLKHLEDPEAVTIAPRKWAGRNKDQEWVRPMNYYKKFTYI